MNHLQRGSHEAAERTIIITGVARSGTSMAAAVLERAGVHLGVHDEVVYEDLDLMPILDSRDHAALEAMIGRRDRLRPVWGFKRPDLNESLTPEAMGLFRNPLLIAMFRDIAAVAQRSAISELLESRVALALAAGKLAAFSAFVATLTCPMLLISYEKAIAAPEAFVDGLIAFCGLAVNAAQRRHMISAVEPNRPDYLRHARRLFEGYVDCVEDGILYGWCRQSDSLDPVSVTLSINDVVVASLRADKLRRDLAAIGIGLGLHGFEFDLNPLALCDQATISATVEGRQFTLRNSGCTIARLREVALLDRLASRGAGPTIAAA